MTYGRVDDKLHSHPKIIALGPHMLAAVGLGSLAQSWSNDALTDGFIPAAQVPRLAGRNVAAVVKSLVDVGLWDVVPGGYRIHDFHDYNPKSVDVRARRAADLARKRGGFRTDSAPDSTRIPTPPSPNNQDRVVTERSSERPVTRGSVMDHPAVQAYMAAARGAGLSDALLYPKIGAVEARARELIAEGESEADVVWAYAEIGRKGGSVARPDIELERRARDRSNSITGQQAATEAALRALA